MVKKGRNAQLGVAEETTYGTLVTPARFYEFRSEGLQNTINRIESQAIRKGDRLLRSDRWAPGQQSVAGDIAAEIAYKSFGLWFKHAFGSVATSQPDATNNPDVYEHLFTLGDLEQHSLTAQIGLDDVPKAYTGVVVTSWSIEVSNDGFAVLTLSLAGREEDLSASLATVSYPAGLVLLPFTHASLDIAGSAMQVSQANIQCDNQMATDRYALGSGLMRRPAEVERRAVTGSVEADFDSLTDYNRYINGTESKLSLSFVGPAIDPNYNYELAITVNARYDGQTPTVGGFEEIRQPLDFKAVDPDDGTASFELLYRTDDATP